MENALVRGRAGHPTSIGAHALGEELWEVQRELDFPGTVFGISREEAAMPQVTGRCAELFGRHREDRVLS